MSGNMSRAQSTASTGSLDSDGKRRRRSSRAATTWGTVGHLSEVEQATLEKFRKFVDDIGYPRSGEDRCDERCLVFLRARKFNLDQACKMYDAYARWRAENNVEGILSEKMDRYAEIRQVWVFSFHKRDKIGRPIYIERTGYVDVAKLIKQGLKPEEILRFHIYQQEYMYQLCKEASRREGRHIEQIFSIMDLTGCSVSRHMNKQARHMFAQLASIDSNHYPECLGKLMIVNAPAAFPIAWNFIKPLLDPRTRSKIEVFKAGKHVNKMKQFIAVENIPTWLGGKCECPNGGCLPVDGRKNYDYAVCLGHEPVPNTKGKGVVGNSRVQEIVEDVPSNLIGEGSTNPFEVKKKGLFSSFKCGKTARMDVSEPTIAR